MLEWILVTRVSDRKNGFEAVFFLFLEKKIREHLFQKKKKFCQPNNIEIFCKKNLVTLHANRITYIIMVLCIFIYREAD